MQQLAVTDVTQGFESAYKLAGGIDAWSTQVDAGVPRY